MRGRVSRRRPRATAEASWLRRRRSPDRLDATAITNNIARNEKPEERPMRSILSALVVASAALIAQPAQAQAQIVLKFSHVVAPETPKGKGAEKFKELGEKYTNGKVKIEVYHNSTLYKDKEELEAMQLGAVQMLAPSNSKFGPIGIKEFEVFDLPYLLPSKAALRKV